MLTLHRVADLHARTGEELGVSVDRVDELPGGATLFLTLTFERASGGKPACVAQALYRVFEETS
jgi:hypothetical protein